MRGLEDHRQVPVQLLPSAIKWVTQPPWSGQGFPHASPHPRGRQGAPWRSPSWEGDSRWELSLVPSQSLFSACQHPNQPGLDASHTRSHTSGRVRVRRRRAKALLRGCAKGLAAATCRPQPSPNLHLPTRPLFTGHVHVAPKYRFEALSGASCGDRHCHPLSRPGTYHRRFRGRDPEPLGQNAGEVGGSRPVPQQPPVVQLLERLVALVFPFSLDLKDLVGVVGKGER